MNHVPYQLARIHQDELLRQAADHRLARQAASAAVARSSKAAHRPPLKLRLLWIQRSSSHG